MNLAFLNGFSVLLTSFIVVVVVVLLMLIFLLQSFILFYFLFIELYSAHLIYAVAMFFDMPILYFMALSYIYISFDFPAEICGTSQRPDIVVWSPLSKIVILIELTCPAEEGIQNATNRKQERYTDLQLLIRQNNWKSHLFTIEVGARGFVAKSTIKNVSSTRFLTW